MHQSEEIIKKDGKQTQDSDNQLQLLVEHDEIID